MSTHTPRHYHYFPPLPTPAPAPQKPHSVFFVAGVCNCRIELDPAVASNGVTFTYLTCTKPTLLPRQGTKGRRTACLQEYNPSGFTTARGTVPYIREVLWQPPVPRNSGHDGKGNLGKCEYAEHSFIASCMQVKIHSTYSYRVHLTLTTDDIRGFPHC